MWKEVNFEIQHHAKSHSKKRAESKTLRAEQKKYNQKTFWRAEEKGMR